MPINSTVMGVMDIDFICKQIDCPVYARLENIVVPNDSWFKTHQCTPKNESVVPRFEANKKLREASGMKAEEKLVATKSTKFKANRTDREVEGRCAPRSQVGGRAQRSKQETSQAVGRTNLSHDERGRGKWAKTGQEFGKKTGTRIAHSPSVERKKLIVACPDKERRLQEDAGSKGGGFYRPVPNFDRIFRPKLQHKVTTPVPFSFEIRDREKTRRKEMRERGKIAEERQRARPLRGDEPPLEIRAPCQDSRRLRDLRETRREDDEIESDRRRMKGDAPLELAEYSRDFEANNRRGLTEVEQRKRMAAPSAVGAQPIVVRPSTKSVTVSKSHNMSKRFNKCRSHR